MSISSKFIFASVSTCRIVDARLEAEGCLDAGTSAGSGCQWKADRRSETDPELLVRIKAYQKEYCLVE